MSDTFNYYEQQRDNVRFPSCWRSMNNFVLPHFHGSLELVYVEEGEMDAYINGENIIVSSGEILLIPIYYVHRFSTALSSNTIVLTIPPDYTGRFTGITKGKQFTELLIPAGKATKRIAEALFYLLADARPSGKEIIAECRDSLETRGLIYMILGIILETVPLKEQLKESGQNPIRDILAYIGETFREPINVDILASEFGYSRSHISHLFKKNVGSSIPEYINLLRTRAAVEMLLSSGNLTITEAAFEAGFDSIRTFYRAFKFHFGTSPSQYFKLAKNKEATIT